MPTRLVRLTIGVVVAALTAASCTAGDPTPEPTPDPSAVVVGPQVVDDGYRIAVVVGPRSLVAAGEAAALARAAATLTELEGVTEVRVLDAQTSAFARDLLRFAADEGYDLVCLVGTGTSRLLASAARDRRATEFCGTDASIENASSNVTVVGLDATGLLGVAAAAVGPAPSPVGLISVPAFGPAEDVLGGFSGVLPAAPAPAPAPSASAATGGGADTQAATGAGSPTPGPTPAATPVSTSDQRVVNVATGAGALPTSSAVEQLIAIRPSIVALLATSGGPEAARAFAEAGVVVVTVDAWAVDDEGALPGNVLAAITIGWGQMLLAAVTAAREEGSAHVGTLGIPEGIFGVVEGQADGAAAAATRVRQHLADAGA